jgi:microcystin-dependent protein
MDGTIGEIRGFAGGFAPMYWNYCDGTVMQIRNNAALFSIIGNAYGGDGVNTFALPDLRGRVPAGQGTGPGLTAWPLALKKGGESVTLSANNLAAHIHAASLSGTAITGSATPRCLNDAGGESSPAGHVMASIAGAYAAPGDADSNMASIPITLNPGSVGVTVQPTGSNLPVSIIQPSLSIAWIICVEGIYPMRN